MDVLEQQFTVGELFVQLLNECTGVVGTQLE